MNTEIQVVVVGSVAFDSIRTSAGFRERMLGGSATYAALASALTARTGLVGVVGTDFPASYWEVFQRAGVDTTGLTEQQGPTFLWSAAYDAEMDNRETLMTQFGVFANFQPRIPKAYQKASVLVLGNIAPTMQARVLDQMNAELTMLDTMNLWIDTAREELEMVIRRVDLVTLNESEARELTGEASLVRAGRALLAMGPKWALVKKGSNGAFLMGRDGPQDILMCPAWPLANVKDPTGAGDSFAGAFAASVANSGGMGRECFRDALVWATVVAARTCGEFGVDALSGADAKGLMRDREAFAEMVVR